MEKTIFSLHDIKAKAFTLPFFMDQKGQALRALDGIVNDENTQVHKYPEDFKLYKLGTFDDNSGLVCSLSTPEFLVDATDFVKTKE